MHIMLFSANSETLRTLQALVSSSPSPHTQLTIPSNAIPQHRSPAVAGVDRTQLLALIRNGLSCRAIAEHLGLSVAAVKAELTLLYRHNATGGR